MAKVVVVVVMVLPAAIPTNAAAMEAATAVNPSESATVSTTETTAASMPATTGASLRATTAAVGARYTSSRQADAQCDRQYPEPDRAG